MPPKRINPDHTHGYIGQSRGKSKAKEYVESESLAEYRRHSAICHYIQHGGECRWPAEEIELVKQKYFKDYQTKLL